MIVGKSGQVARELRFALQGHEVVSTSSKASDGENYLDLANPTSIPAFFDRFSSSQKVRVFLPGALTHVDRCETERDLCRAINFDGPVNVAKECKRRGYDLCFFSTEYVFGDAEYHGGAVGPFSETDEPAPTSWYGQCKLDAEIKLQEIFGADGLCIVRTTMVFSWDSSGVNFFMQLYRHMEKMKSGEPAAFYKIPLDQISTPTFGPFLAQTASKLMHEHRYGVWNVVGSDLLSREEFLRKMVSAFGFSLLDLHKGFQFLKTKEMGQVAKRPLTAGLSTKKLQGIGIVPWSLEASFDAMKKLAEMST